MERWREVWRKGFSPLMPTTGLEALAEALRSDDPKLVQGATTVPPPLQCIQDWPVEGACAVTYCGWKAKVAETGGCLIGDAEEFFARACFDCDAAICEPAGCRHFLVWFDETPRAQVREEFFPEVELELARRREVAGEGLPERG